MDVMFVVDASDSIVRDVPPKCYDSATNQQISCAASPPPATMVQVLDEYAKARNFAKKFMSYFVIKPTAVKLGYVAFTKDVVLTRADGKQACANELAAKGTRFTFGQDAAVEYDECASPFPLAVESDLENVLADDSTKAARQIDMKYFKGGTKMFLGKEQVDGMEGMAGMEGKEGNGVNVCICCVVRHWLLNMFLWCSPPPPPPNLCQACP
jgi:hypothetical protein